MSQVRETWTPVLQMGLNILVKEPPFMGVEAVCVCVWGGGDPRSPQPSSWYIILIPGHN